MMTFEDETGIESRASRSLLPGYCLESPALSSVYNHPLSPADTVRDDGDGIRDTPAEFRISQCFGDYSTNGEAAQGKVDGLRILRCNIRFRLAHRSVHVCCLCCVKLGSSGSEPILTLRTNETIYFVSSVRSLP